MVSGFNSAWQSDFSGASTLPTRFNSSFNGGNEIRPADAQGHHLSSQDLLSTSSQPNLPPLNPRVRDIVIELGTVIDPQTQRAVFDVGSRADNRIDLSTGSLPGQVTHNNNHPGARELSREIATRAAQQYVDARAAGQTHLDALRVAGKYWTGMNNAQKMVLVGAYTNSDLGMSGKTVALTTNAAGTIYDNPTALANALEGTAAFTAGNQHGRVLDFSGLGYNGEYKDLLARVARITKNRRVSLASRLASISA